MKQADMLPVSVVIPCYRCARSVTNAVVSVAAQVGKPAEVFLVDDGSKDDTLSRLRAIASQYPGWVKVIELDGNQGAAAARNAGWEQAGQPYVAFLDADDAWHPKKLEIQYRYMRDHPEVALCGHAHRLVRGSDAPPDWQVETNLATKRVSKLAMLVSNRFITPSVMLKRDIPFRFAEGKRHMEDHLLWMQVICAGLPVAKISSELAAIYKFPYGVDGLSGQYRQMHAAELDNYRLLRSEGHIGLVTMLLLIVLARLKYLKRRIVIALSRTK